MRPAPLPPRGLRLAPALCAPFIRSSPPAPSPAAGGSARYPSPTARGWRASANYTFKVMAIFPFLDTLAFCWVLRTDPQPHPGRGPSGFAGEEVAQFIRPLRGSRRDTADFHRDLPTGAEERLSAYPCRAHRPATPLNFQQLQRLTTPMPGGFWLAPRALRRHRFFSLKTPYVSKTLAVDCCCSCIGCKRRVGGARERS
jgi:hypothetical protein